MAFIVKRDAPPAGIIVANRNQITLATSHVGYSSYAYQPHILERQVANQTVERYQGGDEPYLETWLVGPNINYFKFLAPYGGYELVAPQNRSVTANHQAFGNTTNYWRLVYYDYGYNDGITSVSPTLNATNSSTDPTIVPIIGWSLLDYFGGYNEAFTLT
jgi:hypothetical protein